MNHLTDEQLAEWLAGEASSETNSHLENCAQCRAESLNLKDGISRYAIAMRQQSSQAQSAHMSTTFAPRKALVLHRLRWIGAGVLALLLTAQTAWMVRPQRPAPVAQPIAVAPVVPHVAPYVTPQQPAIQMSDDELLEAVNSDLSREVPLALAPVSAITQARNKIAVATSDGGSVSSNKGEDR